jgi:hypothetical protein
VGGSEDVPHVVCEWREPKPGVFRCGPGDEVGEEPDPPEATLPLNDIAVVPLDASSIKGLIAAIGQHLRVREPRPPIVGRGDREVRAVASRE